jgi:TfoX/Sxy family transcriptional regulator of competence genes
MTQKTGESLYKSIAEELSTHPAVKKGAMFGNPCLKLKNKMFAGLWKGSLLLKIGVPRVQALIKDKGGQPFDPSGKNRAMKEWVVVAVPKTGADKKWLALAQEAKAFVESKL